MADLGAKLPKTVGPRRKYITPLQGLNSLPEMVPVEWNRWAASHPFRCL